MFCLDLFIFICALLYCKARCITHMRLNDLLVNLLKSMSFIAFSHASSETERETDREKEIILL